MNYVSLLSNPSKIKLEYETDNGPITQFIRMCLWRCLIAAPSAKKSVFLLCWAVRNINFKYGYTLLATSQVGYHQVSSLHSLFCMVHVLSEDKVPNSRFVLIIISVFQLNFMFENLQTIRNNSMFKISPLV